MQIIGFSTRIKFLSHPVTFNNAIQFSENVFDEEVGICSGIYVFLIKVGLVLEILYFVYWCSSFLDLWLMVNGYYDSIYYGVFQMFQCTALWNEAFFEHILNWCLPLTGSFGNRRSKYNPKRSCLVKSWRCWSSSFNFYITLYIQMFQLQF